MTVKIRAWWLASGFIALLIALAGVLYFLLPQLNQAVQLNSQSDSMETLIAVQNEQIAELQAVERESEELNEQLAALQAALPLTADWPGFLQQIQAIENSTGARVVDVSVSQAGIPLSAQETVDAVAEGETEGVVTEEISGDIPAEPGQAGVQAAQIPITVAVNGTNAQVFAFAKQVQQLERLLVATNTNYVTDGENTRLTLDGFIYSAP